MWRKDLNAREKTQENPRRFSEFAMQLVIWILGLIGVTMLQVALFWARGYILNEIYHRV